jgi:outer membrane protein insertion porin family
MSLKASIVLTAALLLALSFSISGQQTFKIAKIEFEGLNRLSLDEMIATTGLKVGEQFELSALDAAAQRLVDSGFFKNVAYRTRPNRDQITITFIVEESKVTTSRVVFDNFIWFSDTELVAAVQREVPTFSGTAPDNGDTIERITKALQRFLHEHQIESTVSYMASQDSPASISQEHVFSVNGIPMPICTLHFPGASNISEAKLIESSKSLFGNDYSNKYVSLFSVKTLVPLYQEVGQLKAAFSPPLAKPEESANCKSGVDLTIPVDEGPIYKWDKAEWSGNTALTNQQLTELLGMQTGQPANGVKIDKAAREIQKAYGRKGYLMAFLRGTPNFDDKAQTVSYRMDVREGPQFHMGQFITKGFPEGVDKRIHERWGLKPGEVFDDGYSMEFSKNQFSEALRPLYLERRAQGKPAPNLKWNRNLNRTALTVEVVLELTN